MPQKIAGFDGLFSRAGCVGPSAYWHLTDIMGAVVVIPGPKAGANKPDVRQAETVFCQQLFYASSIRRGNESQ